MRATKRKGQKRKHERAENAPMLPNGKRIFVPHENCILCKFYHKKEAHLANPEAGPFTLRKPKRGHHPECPEKPSNKQKQSTTLFSYTAFGGAVTQMALLGGNNGVPAEHEMMETAPALTTENQNPRGFYDCHDGEVDVATDIRLEIEHRIQSGEGLEEIRKCKAPLPVTLAMDYIQGQIEHRRPKSTASVLPFTPAFKKAMERYKEYFPLHTCTFTFPKDPTSPSNPPLPHYHQIEGTSIAHLDWQLMFPSIPLPCPDCVDAGTSQRSDGCLEHSRTNWSKNKSLFPIWNIDGSVTWAVCMDYTCKNCKATVRANDGRLLHLLPPHMRSCYPVLPKYADIEELRHSKQWKTKCDPYLRKVFHAEHVIQQNLEEWIEQYNHKIDDNGREVFTSKTVDVTREQLGKVKYVLDSERASMYGPIAANVEGHPDLNKWESNRPESALEYFHQLLAHYANSGTNSRLSDALNLRGTAEYNVGCRWKKQMRAARLANNSSLPKNLDATPLFLDHALLQHINQLAMTRSVSKPFDHVHPTPKKNNSEVFGWKYYIAQLQRNRGCHLANASTAETTSNRGKKIQSTQGQHKRHHDRLQSPPKRRKAIRPWIHHLLPPSPLF